MAPDYGKMKIAELKKGRESVLCAVRDCLVSLCGQGLTRRDTPIWPSG